MDLAGWARFARDISKRQLLRIVAVRKAEGSEQT
jgi:hypothetical protein